MTNRAENQRHFASDNYAGICPEAWEAMAEANHDHYCSYGDDPWTDRAANLIRETFEYDCDVFFVFNGTAANSLALASLCQSYHSILCHETAHVETDECGAPEFFSNGTKVLLVSGALGKIDPDLVEFMAKRRTDIHYPKPKVLSLTQATELGTVYSVSELRTATDKARKLGLKVHMDGARFANAIAALRAKPREISWEAGIDVLCLGGAKNGMAMGETVVFFNKECAQEFDYRCKQAGQLASKMRFLAAPWVGMLRSGAWLKNATQANQMAALLAEKLQAFQEIQILFPCQANSVFVQMPTRWVEALHQRGWLFYTFIGQGGCRLMCAWDTMPEDVDRFIADVRLLSAKQEPAW
jgi:threonine aldolase